MKAITNYVHTGMQHYIHSQINEIYCHIYETFTLIKCAENILLQTENSKKKYLLTFKWMN